MKSKITVIGAGSVGATIAYTLSNEDIATEIVLIDINKQKAEGEVMEITRMQRTPISSSLRPAWPENPVSRVLN